VKSISLRDGTAVPQLGLGTWKSDAGLVRSAVREAIRVGYRHIDCAPVYGNEREVGDGIADALADGVVKREDLWVTSKLWNDSHARDAVVPALEQTLGDLQLNYLDLYLIHWPVAHRPGVSIPSSASDLVPLSETPLIETWRGMEAARESKLARHIGVSNFSAHKLDALVRDAAQAPEVNQIELHPYLQQDSMLAYCTKNGIAITAYSPLGSPDRNPAFKPADEPNLLEDPVLLAIAQEIHASPAQVLLAWAFQRDTIVIPKSVTPARIAENFAAQSLELSSAQLSRLAAMDRHRRYVLGRFFELPGGTYNVSNLWDESLPD
jgi:alcohol dehydrogenase (NADP+)